MSRSLMNRIAKLEEQSDPDGAVHVVFGSSDEEHAAEVDRLKRSGMVRARDLIVCITRFASSPSPEVPHASRH